MTATLYPNRRADRVAPRPIGFAPRTRRTHSADTTVGAGTDGPDAAVYAIRRTAAALLAVVVIAIAVIAASALVGAIGDVGGRPAAASDITSAAVGAPIVRIHVAQPGDTLWSIADRYRGQVGQNRFVDALIDVNGGTVIQVGQAVRLP